VDGSKKIAKKLYTKYNVLKIKCLFGFPMAIIRKKTKEESPGFFYTC
jgi:hypothetical protein